MRRYRKRPIVIEAIQYTGRNLAEIKDWCPEALKKRKDGSISLNNGLTVVIHTLEGEMKLRVGDFLIKGIKGEFYPCKEHIFEDTYEDA